jgi:hypothetical protein
MFTICFCNPMQRSRLGTRDASLWFRFVHRRFREALELAKSLTWGNCVRARQRSQAHFAVFRKRNRMRKAARGTSAHPTWPVQRGCPADAIVNTIVSAVCTEDVFASEGSFRSRLPHFAKGAMREHIVQRTDALVGCSDLALGRVAQRWFFVRGAPN